MPRSINTVLIIIIATSLVAASGVFLLKQTSSNQQRPSVNQEEPSLKLKSIGVAIDYYDPKNRNFNETYSLGV